MANSVTARFNDDCKVFVSMSDDTTVEKAVIIDAEGNETDIGGGGGESDFSTAEVTISNTGGSTDFDQYVIPVVDNDSIMLARAMQSDNERKLTAVLYKGSLIIYTGGDVVVSGDAQYDNDTGFVTITGDCTLKGYLIM